MNLPLSGNPTNESPEQALERQRINLERFYKWSIERNYSMLVSYMRSGRNWISGVVAMATGFKIDDPYDINYNIYNQYALFVSHGERAIDVNSLKRDKKNNRIILILRDPRDSALSAAYRKMVLDSMYYRVPFNDSDSIVKWHLERVSKVWPNLIHNFFDIADLVIKYEDICMNPLGNFRAILDIIGFKDSEVDLRRAIAFKDAFTGIMINHEKLVVAKKSDAIFLEDRERYEHHCGKHLTDENFLQDYNDILSKKCVEVMNRFGYYVDKSWF